MADTRSCAHCGQQIAAHKRSEARYCSRHCLRLAMAKRARAEGRWTRTPERTVPLRCNHCGVDYQGCNPKQDDEHRYTYCSPACQAEAKAWRYRTKFNSPIPWANCVVCERPFVQHRGWTTCAKHTKPADEHTPRWVAGPCIQCGELFVGRWHPEWPCRFCSDGCAKRYAKATRRARKRNVYTEDVWRTVVYERDQWTCGICLEPVDRSAAVPEPLAPTLDHILPLALGGDHSYANVQCAHFICNSRKGATSDAQLRLAA